MDPFSFRLNCLDHYQSVPTIFDPQVFSPADFTSEDRIQTRRGVPRLPVIRAFGSTATGQKVCAHIHGALPYLYIKYEGNLDSDDVETYIGHLRLSIDHALASSYRRSKRDEAPRFVGHISLVKGVPFYGYHVGYSFFMKIYLLNPLHIARLADLLCQGAIMNAVLQPFESHLQYLLQWMCDFNLYGCAFIHCSKVKFRGPVPSYSETDGTVHKWHDNSILGEWISDPNELPRESHCALEIDVCVEDILNRNEIRSRDLHRDFNERFHTMAPDEKWVQSMAGLWRDETRRRRERMAISDPGSSPFPPEILVTMSADPRNTQKSGWVHEESYREAVEALLRREQSKDAITFEDFEKSQVCLNIRTALESVQDLFSHNVQRFPPKLKFGDANGVSNHSIDGGGGRNDDVSAGRHQEDGQHHLKTEPMEFTPKTPDSSFEDAHDNAQHERYGLADHTAASHKERLIVRTEPESNLASPKPDSNLASPKPGDGPIMMSRSTARVPLEHLGDESSGRLVCEDGPKIHDSPRKRSSAEPGCEQPRKRVAFGDTPGSHPAKGDSQPGNRNDCPSSKSSSQASIKSSYVSGSTTLSFPVVKNPQDPKTIFRLSQAERTGPNVPLGSAGARQEQEASKEAGQIHPVRKTPEIGIRAPHSVHPVSRPSATVAAGVSLQRVATRSFCYGQMPPSTETVMSTMSEFGLAPVIHQNAYYSVEGDVPERSREYASREFVLQSKTLPFLPDFDCSGGSPALRDGVASTQDRRVDDAQRNCSRFCCTYRNWEILQPPPSFARVEKWSRLRLAAKHEPVDIQKRRRSQRPKLIPRIPHRNLSQIDGPTQKDKYDFKFSRKQKSTSVHHETQYMSIMSLEVHVNTRGSLSPDPAEDEVSCVFWSLASDDEDIGTPTSRTGIVLASDETSTAAQVMLQQRSNVQVDREEDELDLINRIIDIVRASDPDILTGYEVHNGSWGFLIERARLRYELDLCDELSRMRSNSHGRFGKDADRWGFTHTSTIRVTGRHMINLWRAMRSEVNLLQYTMENVVFHHLHKRIPHYSFQDLTRWYKSRRPKDVALVMDYFLSRVQLDLEILDANELIPRTSEQARLLGVDFFSVFSRGSQFKVESLMFRIAKPENYILISPSRKQVGQQNALECIPLVMEPQSNFYPGPLLVLDFQSLYPSVMIAYNYCYSTCLGRIEDWRGKNKLGFTELHRPPGLLQLLKDHINIAPNGIMYIKQDMRKSLLARMLAEILETRVMVKSGMKVDKDDTTLQQLLNNRQLALKLIANVTYGYTSASFSGRMPCSEIADSIVQTARETLEKAVSFIHSVERWGAEVVYGDTDSLFVYLKGRSRHQAFEIGRDIADTITKMNPRPVKLKFEKVYHPCVLLAKKRYVGFKFESPDQRVPEFDAKGIETVRRDGTPAEQKIEEKALKILFRTADMSKVKDYFLKQCQKIMAGKVSIQDFLFAREVRLGTYSDKGLLPPGALIATRRMLADRRTEPQYGERVPFAVITGAPGARLIDRCVEPEVLLGDGKKELDAEYYITKNLIPPLERIFNLVGANVRQWYDEMPKVQRIRSVLPTHAEDVITQQMAEVDSESLNGPERSNIKKTLENYLKSSACLVCRTKLGPPDLDVDLSAKPVPLLLLCTSCSAQPASALWHLRRRLNDAELRAQRIDLVCHSCSGIPLGQVTSCDSRDCPVFYSRVREKAALEEKRRSIGDLIKALEELDTELSDA